MRLDSKALPYRENRCPLRWNQRRGIQLLILRRWGRTWPLLVLESFFLIGWSLLPIVSSLRLVIRRLTVRLLKRPVYKEKGLLLLLCFSLRSVTWKCGLAKDFLDYRYVIGFLIYHYSISNKIIWIRNDFSVSMFTKSKVHKCFFKWQYLHIAPHAKFSSTVKYVRVYHNSTIP